MSIETLILQHTQALLENTEAVKLLTAAMAGGVAVTVEKPKAEIVGKTHDKVIVDEIAAGEITDPITETEETATDPVQYETVRALVLKLAPTQREAIKAMNATHGLTNAKDMLRNPDDFTSVKDQAKLEAYYADLQALEG